MNHYQQGPLPSTAKQANHIKASSNPHVALPRGVFIMLSFLYSGLSSASSLLSNKPSSFSSLTSSSPSPRPKITCILSPLYLLLLWTSLAMPTTYAFKELSDAALQTLPSAGSNFDINNPHGLLAPLLIPRVPGTPGQDAAQRHFLDFFAQKLPAWKIDVHNLTSTTPLTGDRQVPFANLIFTRDPPWAAGGDVGRLTLVAHYDSKVTPEGFIGATDSAAPCAMLMHVARSIDAALSAKWKAMEDNGEAGIDEDKGIQIMLLDGEEAWLQWTDTDSLYGSRALAQDWESELYPALSTYRSPLNAIDLFVLFDLLGAPNPNVPSYFPTTHWAYRNMARIEKRLRNLRQLQSHAVNPFLPDIGKTKQQFRGASGISDDHVPFLVRGVPVLHVIPSPFPQVWHTIYDDGLHLDIPSCHDWAMITTAFTIEWMELEEYMGAVMTRKEKRDKSKVRIDRENAVIDEKQEL